MTEFRLANGRNPIFSSFQDAFNCEHLPERSEHLAVAPNIIRNY